MSDNPSRRVLYLAIQPKTKVDQEKLGQGLQKLTAEDPTLGVQTDPQTGQVIIAGMGEPHLEIIVDRLKREFNVEALVGKLQVAYKETLTRPADGEMKCAKQTSGRGQYGHCKIHLFPAEPGSGYIFQNEIVGSAVPTKFIKPIDEGIKAALTGGVLAGYPIDDVRIVLYDGSYHEVDSSEMAFKIARSMAFQDAAKKARPVLLEPVMRVEVVVPKEHLGDVIGNLSSRRGQIQSQEDRGGTQTDGLGTEHTSDKALSATSRTSSVVVSTTKRYPPRLPLGSTGTSAPAARSCCTL